MRKMKNRLYFISRSKWEKTEEKTMKEKENDEKVLKNRKKRKKKTLPKHLKS